jgi:hypothetical protein
VHNGSTVVWGAVGFRNGGGNDTKARAAATKKFHDDLADAKKENPELQGFIFFTNVDLTPTIIENLKLAAVRQRISVVDIVDFERLRHVLDSAEGLIPRLQFLEIPMSPTEQIGLVNKFGSQLQNAVTARFDRVEQTLFRMERFFDYQKPIYRMDFYVELNGQHSSLDIGSQGILLELGGLPTFENGTTFLLWNYLDHPSAGGAPRHVISLLAA